MPRNEKSNNRIANRIGDQLVPKDPSNSSFREEWKGVHVSKSTRPGPMYALWLSVGMSVLMVAALFGMLAPAGTASADEAVPSVTNVQLAPASVDTPFTTVDQTPATADVVREFNAIIADTLPTLPATSAARQHSALLEDAAVYESNNTPYTIGANTVNYDPATITGAQRGTTLEIIGAAAVNTGYDEIGLRVTAFGDGLGELPLPAIPEVASPASPTITNTPANTPTNTEITADQHGSTILSSGTQIVAVFQPAPTSVNDIAAAAASDEGRTSAAHGMLQSDVTATVTNTTPTNTDALSTATGALPVSAAVDPTNTGNILADGLTFNGATPSTAPAGYEVLTAIPSSEGYAAQASLNQGDTITVTTAYIINIDDTSAAAIPVITGTLAAEGYQLTRVVTSLDASAFTPTAAHREADFGLHHLAFASG